MSTLPEGLQGYEPLLAIAIVAILFIVFLSERYPPAVAAIGGAALFLVTGLVPPADAMKAFGNSAPITIGAMFILSGALVRTGVLDHVAELLVSRSGSHPRVALGVALVATCAVSAFVNNTPLVMVLVPLFIRLAEATGLPATRVLIPLSYAAILGGTCSLIGTSTNLLVDGVARGAGLEPFGIFDIAPVGIVAAIAGTATMLLLGPVLLPSRPSDGPRGEPEAEYLSEVGIREETRLIGRRLGEVADFNRREMRVLGLRRDGKVLRSDLGDIELQKDDTVILTAPTTELLTLDERSGLRVGLRRGGTDGSGSGVVAEAILSPRRARAGGRLADLAFGARFGMRILGVARQRHVPGPDLENVRPRSGDRLLLRGNSEGMNLLAQDNDLVSVSRTPARAYRRGKGPLAVLAVFGVVGLAALDVMDIGGLAMIAVALLLLVRCIDADEAWASIDGSILVMIFAMLVIGAGLEKTGAVHFLVEAIAPHIAGYPPVVTLIVIYAITSLLTEIVTNNAVAIILTPIAIGLANSLGVDPTAFVVAVMFGSSASFATPIGYQTNTLVYGAGNYRFADFLKIGVPMNLIVGAVSCLAICVFFPL